MRKLGTVGMAAVAIGLLAGSAARASILLAQYHLGESDPLAVAGAPGNSSTVDSSVNGFDLTARNGTPTYSSNVAPGTGSTLSMAFSSAAPDQYSRPAALTSDITNVIMEAWAYPTNTTDVGYVALNGDGSNGYGILQYTNTWSFIESFVSFNFAGPVVPNQWVNLKLVLDRDGTLTGYINGVLSVTQTAHAIAPSGLFLVGSGLNGNIDEITVSVPEPAAAGMLLAVTVACVRVRRRCIA